MQAIEAGWAYLGLAPGPARVDYDMTQRVHLDVLCAPCLYDPEMYGAYMEWYVPRTRVRPTIPPPERPEQVTEEMHQQRLHCAYDCHAVNRKTLTTSGRFIDDIRTLR